MKRSPMLLALTGAAALSGAFLLPQPSSGQAPAASEAALTLLLAEVTTQQTAVVANQTKIDEQLAVIGENVRVARIFVSRGGGKAK